MLGDALEIEALAAGEDGGKDFVGFGGGEDELHVGRRFFQRFEKGVEGCRGQHVDFVDDIDFVFAAGGGVLDVFAEFANLFDAVVGGTVDFQDVHAAAFGDFLADGVIGIEVGFGATGTVEGFGQNAGGGGFSDAAGSDKKEGVGDAAGSDGVGQGLNNVILSHDILETLGTVFAR